MPPLPPPTFIYAPTALIREEIYTDLGGLKNYKIKILGTLTPTLILLKQVEK